MFAGNFPPSGWAFCEGQLMPISENDTLFTLIGTMYGGDGQETFGLPDLRGRLPIHVGPGYIQAQQAGVEQVTLTVNQIPSHQHAPACNSGAGTLASPANAVWAAASTGNQMYADPPSPYTGTMNPQAVTAAGGNQPHDNMAPYLCVNFIISLFGIFPHQ
jgi:microcystin-dependent protein